MKSNTTGWTAKIDDDQTSGFPVRNSLEGVPDYELGSYLPKSSHNSMSSGARTAVLLSPSARDLKLRAACFSSCSDVERHLAVAHGPGAMATFGHAQGIVQVV